MHNVPEWGWMGSNGAEWGSLFGLNGGVFWERGRRPGGPFLAWWGCFEGLLCNLWQKSRSFLLFTACRSRCKILYVRLKWPECVCSQSARTWWSTLLYRLLLHWHMFWESMHSPDFTRFQQLTRAKIPVPCYLKCCNRKWGNHGTEIFRWITEYLFLQG